MIIKNLIYKITEDLGYIIFSSVAIYLIHSGDSAKPFERNYGWIIILDIVFGSFLIFSTYHLIKSIKR